MMLARTLIAAALALGLAGTAFAQDADHPKDKTLVVGSDFGVAPWMVRGAKGPEGFGVDMIKEVAKRMEEHGADVETSTPEKFGELVKSELAKWKGVVQRAKLTAD